MNQLTLSDLPDWLTEHYEKEYGECFIFYKKGDDFTPEQYQELKGFNYYRYSDMIGLTGKARGHEIKLYKSLPDFENSSYQYSISSTGIRVAKRR